MLIFALPEGGGVVLTYNSKQMKTIIYTIIAIFICGLIATGFTGKPFTKQTILLQCTNSHLSAAELAKSADIITMRLKSFSTDKFEIKTFPEKQQIAVILTKTRELEITEKLITQKGFMELYETYDPLSFSELMNGDNTLTNLFHEKTPRNSSAMIGCTSVAEMTRIDQYLQTSRLNVKCRFAWDNLFADSDVCLYALRTGEGNRIHLTGTDIESFESKKATKWQKGSIAFKFKKSAIQTWADVTKRNLNKAVAILLDNKVIFAPFVTSEINGGDCEISGDFTQSQVRYIVAIGNCGVLPADFSVVK